MQNSLRFLLVADDREPNVHSSSLSLICKGHIHCKSSAVHDIDRTQARDPISGRLHSVSKLNYAESYELVFLIVILANAGLLLGNGIKQPYLELWV